MNFKTRQIAGFFCLFLIFLCFFLNGCHSAKSKTEKVSKKEMRFLYQKQIFTGTFTGTLKNGKAEGNGVFSYKDGDQFFVYTGKFQKGSCKGKGTLHTSMMKLKFQNSINTGTYKGSVIDGIPDGKGTFLGKTSKKTPYSYKGQWEDGIWNGEGSLTIDGYTQTGKFQKGIFQIN